MKRFLFLAAVLSMACFFAGTGFAGLNDGLVAYYPFNGNADDATGNGHHGVVHGATPADNRFGHANGAYSFDGQNDYIEINNIPTSHGFTVSAWVKSLSTNWNSYGFVVSCLENNGYAIHPKEGNKTWSGYVVDAEGLENWIGDYTPEDITEYHHYVITYKHENATGRMFFDGVLAAGSSWDELERSASTTIDLLIGKSGKNSYGFGHCVIDDVRIYNRALSDTEVKQLYFGGGEITPYCICPSCATDCSQCETDCPPCGGSGSNECFAIQDDLDIPFGCISYKDTDYSLTLEFNLTTGGWTIKPGSVTVLP